MSIEFVEDVPTSRGRGRGGSMLAPMLDELRKRPKTWARLREVGASSVSLAHYWRHVAGPQYEIRTTRAGAPKGKVHIYGRYVGNGKK